MNPPLAVSPFQGLWLAHFTGLAGLAELPAQLMGGTLHAVLAGSPAALATRLALSAELVAQFVADWRPALAAVAEAGEDEWRAVYDRESGRIAESGLASLRASVQALLPGFAASLAALAGPAGDRGFGEALAALVQVYLALAEQSLAAFCRRLGESLATETVDSHAQLLRLWQEAAAPVHQAALAGPLPAAYARCMNRFDALFAALQAGERA